MGINANTWPSAKGIIEWMYDQAVAGTLHPEAKGRLPHAVCVQEHRLKAFTCGTGIGWGAKRKLNISMPPAQATGPGPLEVSAGVAVCVSSSVGSDHAKMKDIKHLWHRVTARVINVGLPKGVLLVSVYLCTGCGLTGHIMDMLKSIGDWLVTSQRPFVPQGDWNCQPQEL